MMYLDVPSKYYNDDLNNIVSLSDSWTRYTNTVTVMEEEHYSWEYEWFPGPSIGYLSVRRELDTEMIQIIHMGEGFANCEEFFYSPEEAVAFISEIILDYEAKNLINLSSDAKVILYEYLHKETNKVWELESEPNKKEKNY